MKPGSVIDHAWVLVSHDEFEGSVEYLSSTLGVEFGDQYFREDVQCWIAFSADAGVEIISPIGEEGYFADLLRARGSGYWVPVFRVPTLEEGWDRCEKAGNPASGEFNLLGDEPWAREYEVLRESTVASKFGIEFLIGEFKRAGG